MLLLLGKMSHFLPNLNSTLDFRKNPRLGYVSVDPDLETCVYLHRQPYSWYDDGLSPLIPSLSGLEGSLPSSTFSTTHPLPMMRPTSHMAAHFGE